MKKFIKKPDWSAYEEDWLKNYEAANYGKNLSAAVLRRTHALVEKDPRLGSFYETVLEIGAGTMAHFPTVEHDFSRYIASDGSLHVYNWLSSQELDPRVQVIHIDGSKLPFADSSIDRLIATHVLEHVPDPVAALEEWARVVKPGGVVSLILPSDPGLLWRIGRMFGPRARGKDAGLPYDYYMAVEHKNAIHNLQQIVRFHFPDRSERWWPLRVPVADLNLIYGVNCYV